MANTKITMKDLKSKLGNLKEGEIILDVRSADEYRQGHVPGSINIPHTEVVKNLDRLRGYKAIYLHCQAGGRAGIATAELQKAGLENIICVSGSGMGDWVAAGYPVER